MFLTETNMTHKGDARQEGAEDATALHQQQDSKNRMSSNGVIKRN
jgi:hypothetical protein